MQTGDQRSRWEPWESWHAAGVAPLAAKPTCVEVQCRLQSRPSVTKSESLSSRRYRTVALNPLFRAEHLCCCRQSRHGTSAPGPAQEGPTSPYLHRAQSGRSAGCPVSSSCGPEDWTYCGWIWKARRSRQRKTAKSRRSKVKMWGVATSSARTTRVASA